MNNWTINNDVTLTGGENPLLAGRYQVVRQLGTGGMGSVWLAEDRQLDNKLFAVKMLPSILVANKRAYRQLKDEALVAMKLVHPNIVQIRAFEENNGNPFLVMDYIEGQTLDDYLAEKGRLTEDEALRILKPIAAALDYAHGQGVIHRDVKPANVMIRNDGQTFILDFGIAREIQETLTRVTGKLSSGTLLYMSPEQLNGDMPKKEQDIYSFAAMVYECLKGEPPFCRGAIEEQIKNKTPEVLGDDITVASSVMAALAKKPEDRPKTCADVLSGNTNTVQVVDKNRKGERPREPQVRRGVHAAPQIEELSSRVQQSNESPSEIDKRGVWKLFWAIVFLGIVVVYLGMQYRNNFSDWFSDPSPIDLPPKPPQQPLPPEKPKGPTEADVADIIVEATVKKNQLQRIDDADGFERRKIILSDLLTKATSYGKAKQWDKAACNFTNYVDGCNKLITLDGERKITKEKHSAAVASQMQAEKVESSKYASARWSAALDVMKNANEHFSQMEFSEAKRFYESAANQFELCVSEAKTERERQEKEQVRRAKWRKEGDQFIINEPSGFNMTMRWCPSGSFMMGLSPNHSKTIGFGIGEVYHKVTLTKGFWLGETEVTQGQWKCLMGGESVVDLARNGLEDDSLYKICLKKQTIRDYWGMNKNADPNNRCGDLKDNVPIYNITWFEAVEFCKRLTEREKAAGRIPDGYEFRLPTEAEWEYACRAGTDTIIPNGKAYKILGMNNIPALDDIAWYGGNSSVGFNGRGVDTANWKEKQYLGGWAFAREVKGKQPNNWGFYDMIGNVSEWCFDWYLHYPSSVTNPIGPHTGSVRIVRGGGWTSGKYNCFSARRYGESPYTREWNIGFRVALAPVYGGMSYDKPEEDKEFYKYKTEEVRKNTSDAYKAYYKKLYEMSFQLFMKGDIDSADVQLKIGWMYHLGRGVDKNIQKAVEWYRKAAKQGNSFAQVNLGILHANGDGVEKDYGEAVKWYRKAVEKWNADGQNNLGWMYANGLGVTKDESKAVELYLMSANQGNVLAMENLASMYEGGKGVPRDTVEAAKWRRAATEAKNQQNIQPRDKENKPLRELQSVSKVQLWEGGPYWAIRNIGAEKPEDYGYYFWWGDTIGYKREGDRWVASDGSNSNFKFRDSNTPTYGKSVSDLRSEGWITADGVLSPQYDAAQKHWGGNWRMPTDKEFNELERKCDWTWTTKNGVNGYVVRGKGEYSSKSIFLPCAGNGYGTSLSYAGSYGYYWSSVPYSDIYNAWYLGFGSSYHDTFNGYRYNGQSVRPLQGFTK